MPWNASSSSSRTIATPVPKVSGPLNGSRRTTEWPPRPPGCPRPGESSRCLRAGHTGSASCAKRRRRAAGVSPTSARWFSVRWLTRLQPSSPTGRRVTGRVGPRRRSTRSTGPAESSRHCGAPAPPSACGSRVGRSRLVTQAVHRQLPDVVAVRRVPRVDQRQVDLLADVRRSSAVLLLPRRQQARLAAHRVVAVRRVAGGAGLVVERRVERAELLLCDPPGAVARDRGDAVHFEVHRPRAVGDHVVLPFAGADLDAIEPLLEQVDRRSAEEREALRVDERLERTVASLQQDDQLELVAVDARESLGEIDRPRRRAGAAASPRLPGAGDIRRTRAAIPAGALLRRRSRAARTLSAPRHCSTPLAPSPLAAPACRSPSRAPARAAETPRRRRRRCRRPAGRGRAG